MLEQRPETFTTLTDWLRWQFRGATSGVARVLARLGLRPNTVTVLGLLLSAVAGWLAAQGTFVRAGIVYGLAGALDGLDGPLARALGRESRFGAFLDSTLDRYAEGFLLIGLAFWLAENGRSLEVVFVVATLVGSLLVSYTRARAEGLGLDLKIGLLTRVERIAITLLILFSRQFTIGLAALAALVNFTVLQRMVKVYQLTQDDVEQGVAGQS